jgi:restriction system protein
VAVQCKRLGKPVGVAAVQQVVAGARHHGCTRSIVISNQEFTGAAKQLAHTHNCQLIGRRALQAWVPAPARRAV